MGVTLWLPRLDYLQTDAASAEPDVQAPDNTALWDALNADIRNCQHCEICHTRTQVVAGSGNRHSPLLIVGEAPGEEEDVHGEPFVGPAGKLLNEMLFAMGFERQEIFITNVLKCRPPENRDPTPEELAACDGFLQQQIKLINPRVILAVGRVAAQTLLDSTQPIGHLRGQIHQLEAFSAPVIATWHPAYLLRKPTEKRHAWADLLLAMQVLEGSHA